MQDRGMTAATRGGTTRTVRMCRTVRRLTHSHSVLSSCCFCHPEQQSRIVLLAATHTAHLLSAHSHPPSLHSHSIMSAPPAGAAGAPAFDRSAWQASVQVGDLVDGYCAANAASGRQTGWYLCRTIETTEAQTRNAVMYWGEADALQPGNRARDSIQPVGTRTDGKYTGPPQRRTAFLQSLTLPSLTVIPLHPRHQLQRFRFDFDWACSKCKKQKYAGQSQAYSCLPCKYDFCVDCFIADGGVDTHPLPVVAVPVKRMKFENYQKVEFVEELKEYECGVCLAVVQKPLNLQCGQF
jgi:hypothetical protein